MALLDYMTEVRRRLHEHPELSLQERETAALIRAELQKMGYAPVALADTGTYADFIVDPGKPWLLFRADIDALPVREETGLPFASQIPGVMHACGHDGHTAMLLGAAKGFKEGLFTSLNNLRFVFQPAEEQFGGAKRMLEAGVMPENVSGVFAFHIWPQTPYGKLSFRKGTLMAANDSFTIQLKGKGAHAAMRNNGRDALQAGALLAAKLPGLPEQVLAPNHAGLVFVGMMKAGNGYNIVADRCELSGTVRTLTPGDRDAAEQGVHRLAEGIASLWGVTAQVEYNRQYPPLMTDDETAEKLFMMLDPALIHEALDPFMTGEDFAFFTEQAPGGMLLLGCGQGEAPEALHSSRFTFDEKLMELGARTYETLAMGDF